MDKASLRLAVRAKLSSLTDEERRKKSSAIAKNLLSLPEFEAAEKLFLYIPLKSEPDISELAKAASEAEKSVAYPKISGEKMNFFVSRDFEKSALGVYEPVGGYKVPPDGKTLVIVPALAFRRDGYRLGRGGGFYDRFLQDFRGFSVGAAFSFSILNDGDFDAEAHDVPVMITVTEDGIFRH